MTSCRTSLCGGNYILYIYYIKIQINLSPRDHITAFINSWKTKIYILYIKINFVPHREKNASII